MVLKRIFAILLTIIFIFSAAIYILTDRELIKIGVAMPTKTLQRWNQDGANIERGLMEQGYMVDLQYGNNEIDLQIEQIKKMIDEGCKIIIIGAVDIRSLSDILEYAKNHNVKIISYDRLIMNTDAVDYYATFDNLAVGTIQGEYIEEKLDLKNGKGPYNLEITAGSLDDSNTIFFFDGAMEILRPYIKNGQLVVNSGQVAMKDCAISHWNEGLAKERMKNILQNYYRDKNLDVALCPNDSTAIGVVGALSDAGYYTDNKKFPLVTGQDADKKNVKLILNGEQTMSIFKDTRILANQVVQMVNAIIEGKEPETNDIGNYNNGVKVVPSFLIRTQFVDKDNLKELLIDSGYYPTDILE